MTREEAIEFGNMWLQINEDCKGSNTYAFFQVAIKALEQEPILDKIRAEITKYEGDCRLSVDEYPSCKQCTDNVFETIYGIIDKYKSESEERYADSN